MTTKALVTSRLSKAFRWLLPMLFGFCLLVHDALAADKVDIQVIVHSSVNVEQLDREFVAASFLKKVTRWENGATIFPVDLHSRSEIRAVFSNRVLQRSVAAVRNYWQQRIFSGRDVPPPEVDSEAAVVRYVKDHPGAIGYVSSDLALNGVRVVRIH